jgi:hypothetical protein
MPASKTSAFHDRRKATVESLPIGAFNERAILPVDVLSLTDVERSAFADSYLANMLALSGTLGHIRPHQPRGKSHLSDLVRR